MIHTSIPRQTSNDHALQRDDKAKVDNRMRFRHLDELIGVSELLEWQKDNEYILTGYRQASFSISRSLQSIFRFHNETVNIWSHILGSIAFCLVPLGFLSLLDWNTCFAHYSDGIALAIFFASVTACFVFSSSFHIFENHTPRSSFITLQLDHLGIVLVIWGSVVPSIHFGFYDNTRLRHFYWNLVCMPSTTTTPSPVSLLWLTGVSKATASALLAGVGIVRPTFRTPPLRKLRSLLYCLLGATTFISAIHGVAIYGFEQQTRRMGLCGFMGLGVLDLTGAAVYVARVPERWYPRRFDIYGASHQIFHVLVVCGALSHAYGLVSAARYWNDISRR